MILYHMFPISVPVKRKPEFRLRKAGFICRVRFWYSKTHIVDGPLLTRRSVFIWNGKFVFDSSHNRVSNTWIR